MASRSIYIIFLISVHFAWGQTYDGPTWPHEDLEKLERECVSAWRLEFNNKGRLKKDSTLNYAFCYNKASRLSSGVHYNLLMLQDGTLDTINIVEQIREYDANGNVLISVTRKRNLSDMLGPRSINVDVRKEDRTTDGTLTHRLYVQFHDSSGIVAEADGASVLPDYWQIDTTVFEDDRRLRDVSIRKACPECGLRADSTMYLYEGDGQEWTQATFYRDGREDHSSWRQFIDAKLIHRVDSTMNIDYDSTWFRLPRVEENYIYDGDLLIERESINWRDSFHFWTFLPGQRHVPRDQPTQPPVKEVKRFEYENGELIRTYNITEPLGTRDTVVHERSGIDPLDDFNAKRITSRTSAGLPLVITGEQIIVIRPFPDRPRSVIHIHYHYDRPAILTRTDDLCKYLHYHPSH